MVPPLSGFAVSCLNFFIKGRFLCGPLWTQASALKEYLPVSFPLRQNMTDSWYEPFFLSLPDSQDCTCPTFFLVQPSDLNGLKERLRDVFLSGRDPDPLVIDLLGLWEFLAATHVALEVADGEVAGLHARLVEAHRCVVGQYCLLLLRISLFGCIDLSLSFSELELEVAGRHEGANKVITFVRAQGADRGECLLDITNRVCLAVRRGARRGATRALTFPRFWSDLELETGNLPGDATVGAMDDFEDDFGMATKVVIDILPLVD